MRCFFEGGGGGDSLKEVGACSGVLEMIASLSGADGEERPFMAKIVSRAMSLKG